MKTALLCLSLAGLGAAFQTRTWMMRHCLACLHASVWGVGVWAGWVCWYTASISIDRAPSGGEGRGWLMDDGAVLRAHHSPSLTLQPTTPLQPSWAPTPACRASPRYVGKGNGVHPPVQLVGLWTLVGNN